MILPNSQSCLPRNYRERSTIYKRGHFFSSFVRRLNLVRNMDWLPTRSLAHKAAARSRGIVAANQPVSDPRRVEAMRKDKWELFTKRTNDPKLTYLEYRLSGMGVEYKRDGESWHAPCLYVRKSQIKQAWALLLEKWTRNGDDEGPSARGRTSLDDIRDDDPRFVDCVPDYPTPIEMGWVGQDGLP